MNSNKKKEEEQVSNFVERNEKEEWRKEINTNIIVSTSEVGAGINVLLRTRSGVNNNLLSVVIITFVTFFFNLLLVCDVVDVVLFVVEYVQ